MNDLQERIRTANTWWELEPRLVELDAAQCREIEPALARWPDESRAAPSEWMAPIFAGKDPPPALSLCRSVSLIDNSHLEDEELARLLTHPALAGITRLKLGMCARRLRAPLLHGLTALRELTIVTVDPYSSALGDDELAELAAAPLHRVERLSLDMVELRGPGVAALAQSTTLSALRELELYTPATAAVCEGLASGAGLRAVQRLALCADGFTPAAASALAAAEPLLAGLRALEIRVTESSGFDWAEPFSAIASEGSRHAKRLATALARLLPALRDCESVSIEYIPDKEVSRIGREDFAALAAAPKRLREAFPSAMR